MMFGIGDSEIRQAFARGQALRDPASDLSVALARMQEARGVYSRRCLAGSSAKQSARRRWPERKALCEAEAAYVRLRR